MELYVASSSFVLLNSKTKTNSYFLIGTKYSTIFGSTTFPAINFNNKCRSLTTTANHPFKLLSLKFQTPIDAHVKRSNNSPQSQSQSPTSSNANNKKLSIAACSAVTVALAIANRVLYKLALVPMKEYPFFLAQLTTFGYVAIYFSVLFVRYRAGTVTDEMIASPKLPFVIIGLLEAMGVVFGMYSGAMLPGPAIPILTQTFLVWQLAFSMLILGRSYSMNRIVGCFFVAAGVLLSVTSGSEHEQMLSGVSIVWPAMMIASTAFQAVASIIKGKLLDIFVVNSFGSGFQALFVLLFLPLLSNLKGIPLSEFPSYLKSGAACFRNIGTDTTAVVSSLAVMSSVPISIYILSLPLPCLSENVSLSPFFVLGSMVLMMGLIVYNISWPLNHNRDSDIL